jgi:hypothetical protein
MRRRAVGPSRSPVAQALDLLSQRGLGVEPLARDTGAASHRLEADLRALGVEIAQRPLGALDRSPVADGRGLGERHSGHLRPQAGRAHR